MTTAKNGKGRELRGLPAGMFAFESIRREGRIYVDKTDRLVELIDAHNRCFLSRPRRFGKSLTISTLESMFLGRADLFEGLAAENWVREQARHPSPVLTFDMSKIDTSSLDALRMSLTDDLRRTARLKAITLNSDTHGGMFEDLIVSMYQSGGPVVVLIDEYDKPILDCIGDPKLDEIRAAMRSFYTVLKSCERYLRFVMITGISKFSKVGVFSAMNNLVDISMDRRFGDLCGYTQSELETYFSDWLDDVAARTSTTRDDLLARIKDYYDGFCFDGETRLYNPFSTLCFLGSARFRNYWYESGSSWWIVQYMRDHGIEDPDEYCHLEVGEDLCSTQEIEVAPAESFLYQAGYLTIERMEGQTLILNYSNREVHESISRMYLEHVYKVPRPLPLGRHIWLALSAGDVAECVRLYSTAIAGLPYETISRRDEAFFKAMFMMMLRGAGIDSKGEVHGAVGRSDIEIYMDDLVVVLEFKIASDERAVESKISEGKAQIKEKGYAQKYMDSGKKIISGVVVVNDKEKRAIYAGE